MTTTQPTKRVNTGRPFNTTSPLGQWMQAERYGVRDVTRATGINERTLSNYLARRQKIIVNHLVFLTELTGLSTEALNAYQLASDDPTGAATARITTPAAPPRSALVSHIRRRST